MPAILIPTPYAPQASLYASRLQADRNANVDKVGTTDDRVLIPRTCFSIKPGTYLEGKFGVRSEIDVYVGEREARVSEENLRKKWYRYWRDLTISCNG